MQFSLVCSIMLRPLIFQGTERNFWVVVCHQKKTFVSNINFLLLCSEFIRTFFNRYWIVHQCKIQKNASDNKLSFGLLFENCVRFYDSKACSTFRRVKNCLKLLWRRCLEFCLKVIMFFKNVFALYIVCNYGTFNCNRAYQLFSSGGPQAMNCTLILIGEANANQGFESTQKPYKKCCVQTKRKILSVPSIYCLNLSKSYQCNRGKAAWDQHTEHKVDLKVWRFWL